MDNTNETSIFTDMVDTFSVALGSDTIAAKSAHVRYGMLYGFAAGWLLGIWRKSTKPEVNAFGF
jgi:hypothetical protein